MEAPLVDAVGSEDAVGLMDKADPTPLTLAAVTEADARTAEAGVVAAVRPRRPPEAVVAEAGRALGAGGVDDLSAAAAAAAAAR